MSKRITAKRWITAVFTAQCMVGQSLVWAAQVVPDGRTQTQVDRSGNVTDVRTGTVRGANGYNSFKHFNVDVGNTVNLHLPSGTQNLVNLVHDSRTDIHGVLNGIKDGAVGGNVYIANPHGIVVGKTGTVNVGSLNLSTPTPEAMDRVLDGVGGPVDAEAAALLAGELPINADASIRIVGRVNANGDVRIRAGDVSVAGQINALPAPGAGATAGVVNTDGLKAGTALVEQGGEIWILAEGDVAISGELHAGGKAGVDAGNVQVRAGNDIEVSERAQITARGQGEQSDGGTVVVFADRDAKLGKDAVLDASAGSSGDGGFVEFSAKQTVTIDGGELAAGATDGQAGDILIDPTNINWTGSGDDQFSGGANITVIADEKIVLDNVTLSSRKIAGADTRANHATDNSTGNSGNISLAAKQIELNNGTQLLANVIGPGAFSAGNITLTALDDLSTPVFGSAENQVATIKLNNAILKGQDITLTAIATDRYDYGGDVANKVFGFLDNLSSPIDFTLSDARAEVLLDGGSQLTAARDVTLHSEALANAETIAWSTGFAAAWGEAHAIANTKVINATINAGRDVTADSLATTLVNTNVSAVNTGYTNPLPANANKYVDIAVAISKGDLDATTEFGASANVTAQRDLSVKARGDKNLSTSAHGKAYDDGTAAGALAFSLFDGDINATINGVASGGSVTVDAHLNTLQNSTSAASGVGTGILGTALKYIDPRSWAGAIAGSAASRVSSTALSSRASSSATSFGLAASYLHVDHTNNVNAGVANGGKVTAGAGGLDITAFSREDLSYHDSSSVDVARLGGDPTPKKVSLSAAVANVELSNNTTAFIDDSAEVDSAGVINVIAKSEIPAPYERWITLYDAWAKADHAERTRLVFDVLLDSTFSTITGWSQSFAESDKVSMAGSFNILDIHNDAKAWVGDNARVNQGIGGAAAPATLGDLNVAAVAEANIINLSGIFGYNPLKAFTGTQSGSGGFGGAYVSTTFTGGADASIGAGAIVDADQIGVIANTAARVINVGESGGKAGKVSINGVYNEIIMNTHAIAQVAGGVDIEADDLLVAAVDDSQATNAAGGIGSGTSVGVGVSVSYTEANRKVYALLGNAPADLRSASHVANGSGGSILINNNLLVDAITSGALWNMSLAGAFASTVPDSAGPNPKGGLALAGDVSLNINNDVTQSGVSDGLDVKANQSGAALARFGLDEYTSGPGKGRVRLGWDGAASGLDRQYALTRGLRVQSRNTAELRSYSGAVGLAPKGAAGVGINTSINRIGTTTGVLVTGAGTVLEGDDVLVHAQSDADISAVAVAVGVSKQVGVGGSIATNHIGGGTTAAVTGGAHVTAQNNVGVLAEGDDRIQVATGAAGVGASALGLGLSFSLNRITSTTAAYIDGPATRVTALAKDASDRLTVKSGTLTGSIELGDQVELTSYNKLDLKARKATHTVTGLAVNAASSQHVESIAVNIAGSKGAAIGAVENIDIIRGHTQAYILNAQINADNTGAGAGQDVDVRASNIAYGNGFVGNIAAGQGAAGVGADLHDIGRTTWAYSAGGSINARDRIDINALAIQGISSLGVGGSAGGVALAGTVVMGLFNSNTQAWLNNTAVDTSALTVNADSNSDMYLVGGAIAGGGNGGSGSFVITRSNSSTMATIKNVAGSRHVKASGAVIVDATNTTDINHIVVSGALAGGYGIAGMASVNLITDTTEAKLYRAQVGSAGARTASARVKANHSVDIDTKAGALGVGGGGVGVGAGASVNIVKARTLADVNESHIYTAGHAQVLATSQKKVDALAMTAGAGSTAGIGGAAVVTLIGSDVKDEAADEVDAGTLGTADSLAGDDRGVGATQTNNDYVLTAAERSAVNSESQTEVASIARGTDTTGYTHRTAANVRGTGARVDAAQVTVRAIDKLHAKTTVGGFGISAGLGAGAGVGVTKLAAHVEAGIDANAIINSTGTVLVNAQAQDASSSERAIEILALNGGAGLVGLGASVAIGELDNTVNASLGGTVTATGQHVDVTALDATSLDLDAYGAAAGAVGAGAVVATGSKDGTIIAKTLNHADITARSVVVDATVAGRVATHTLGAAGGIGVAVNGSVATAEDKAVVSAYTGDNSRYTLTGQLAIQALATPDVDANAEGYSVSGGYRVGVSYAEANVENTVTAMTGDGTHVTTASSMSVTADQRRSGESAKARAVAAGGALVGSANATQAVASNTTRTQAHIGTNSALTVTNGLVMRAKTDNLQDADVTGISVALGAAMGSNDARASYNTHQLAGVANGAQLNVGSLNIQALGEDRNRADTISGAGAIVASLGAARSTTTGVSVTRVYLENGAAGGTQRVGNAVLKADHLADFDAFTDSVNAGLVGMSGAMARNNNNADVQLVFGAGLDLEALSLDASAISRMRKSSPGRKHVVSKSGGFYDGPAATSYTTYDFDTDIQVGADARVAVVGDRDAPGAYNLSVKNDMVAVDTVKVDSGGAIANAKGVSRITGDLGAAIVIGNRATLDSVGDINLTTRSDADIQANAFVDTYGLAGAGQGESVATANDVQGISVGRNANIVATGELNLLAGADLTGLGILNPKARTNVYNKTAFAYTGTPTADATTNRSAQVLVDTDALVASGRHMTVQAAKDHLFASGVGKATDASREALEAIGKAFGASDNALEVRGGSSNNVGTAGITINGELRTGIYNKVKLTFDKDFSPYYKTTAGTKGKYTVAQIPGTEVWNLFDDAGNIVGTLDASEQTDGIEWTILTDRRLSDTISAEIARLQDLKTRYGGAANPDVDADLATRISILQTQLASRNTNEYVDVIQVSPAVAATGNIHLWADYVVGTGGKINAPGDAAIDIVNESPMPLQLASLTIPDERGGLVKFNNELVHNGIDIQVRNSLFAPGSATSLSVTDAVTSPDPRIVVENRYSHLSGVSNPTGIPNMYDPDLLVTGTVSNINGLVKLDNRWGSIVATAAIRGGDVDISAGGDFFFDAGDTLYNIGPHPMSDQGFGRIARQYEVGTDTTGSRATVEQSSETGRQLYGNNIYITADTININGVIQSGIADKSITISQAEVDAAMAAPGGDLYVPIKYVDETLAGNLWLTDDRRGVGGVYAELDRTPGAENVRIIGTEVKGGTVLLSGRIVSTGKGKVNVVDGFGRISVTNTSTLPVNLLAVDTGGIEGQIIFVDKGRSNGRGLDRVTRYTRLGNDIRVYDNWGLNSAEATRLSHSSLGRESTYNPRANMRYYWMTGESASSQVEKRWYKENNSFLGFIPSDQRSFSDANYVAGYPKTRALTGDELPAGDYVAGRYVAEDYTYRRETHETKNELVSGPFDDEGTNWYWGGFCDCIPKKKTWWSRKEIWETGTNTYNYHSVRADRSINIGFVGYDSGRVVVNSVGGINIAGQFNNAGGHTQMYTSQGDIRSASLAGIRSGDLNMTALNGSVGQAGNYLRLNQDKGDQVYVDAARDIYLESPTGDLRVTRLLSGSGNIGLVAAKDLVVNSVTGVVKGKSVRLEARTGSIGVAGGTVRVDTDAAAGGDLVVKAGQGNVILEEISGDLRIKEIVALSGNVDLTVDGSVLDGNTEAVPDETSLTTLQAMWSDIGLTGANANAKKQQQIDTYEQEQEALYQEYWRNERDLSVAADGTVSYDAYDPAVSFSFTTAQADSLRASGWSDDQITQREAFVTDRYRNFGATAYDPSYQYTATIGEVADLTGGFSWTNDQLKNTLPSFVFKPVTDTTTTIENANIRAQNVKVSAGGQIGAELADLVLTLDGSNVLTPEILTALAAAERDDVTLTDTLLRVRQKEDLDIHASGTIELNATGHIFLGAEQDVNVYAATSGQNIRVKVAGSINNARTDAQAVFRANDLLLEAAGGQIGALSKPMRVDQRAGGALVARAEQGIFINEVSGDMYIDSVFSEQSVALGSQGGMRDWSNDDALNIQAPDVRLHAVGDIGMGTGRAGALEIKIDDTSGRLTLTSLGGGANVFAPGGELPLGPVAVATTLRADSVGDLTGRDAITTGASMFLTAGSDVNLLAATAAGGAATIVGDAVELAAFSAGSDADVTARSGAITGNGALTVLGAGTLLATGDINLLALTDVKGDLSLTGAALSLAEVRVGSDVAMAARSGAITGNGALTVLGAGTLLATGDINLLALTDVKGDLSLTGAALSLAEVRVGSDVAMAARSGAIIGNGALTALGAGTLLATGDINLLAPASFGGDASLAGASIRFQQLTGASDVTMLARSGDILGTGAGIQLVGNNLTLTSLGGSVGLATSLLMGDSNGIVNIAAKDGVYYHERVGDLVSDSITTVNGSMNLLVAGNGDLGKLTAPETVRVEVFGNALAIDDIDPREVILIVHGEGGTLDTTRMTVSEKLRVNADNILLSDVFNPGKGDLRISVSGNDGGMADSLTLSTSGGGGVIFDTFKIGRFDLTSGSDDVAFYGMKVGEYGILRSPTHVIVIDNFNRRLYSEATGQLHSNFKSFDLVLHDERLFDTTALLVNYSPRYIANVFSTENSLTRLEVKRDTLPELTSSQLEDDTTLVDVMVVAETLSSFLTTAGGAAINDDELDTWFLELDQAQAEADIQVIQ